MHALAVCRPDDGDTLRFGLTAAETGNHAGLPTGTVSAQLDIQEREGLVEKTAAHGRTQYRIAEQLFRLWLQMRGSRRIRENVIGLSRFLEAMFSFEELRAGMQEQNGVSPLAEARFAFAVAGANDAMPLRRGLEAKGADHLLQHIKTGHGSLDDYRKAIELDPLDAWPHNGLGILLVDKLNRYEEAELAFRKAIELDPLDAMPWWNLGNLLETRERLLEADAAYAKAIELDADLHPDRKEWRVNLQTRLCASAARQALTAGNLPALRDALGKLLAESADLASALVSKHFVEDFLAPLLEQGEQAATVLDMLRCLDYGKHARPLLLAFEAVVEDRSDMLSELEPEVQRAARRMFERLTGSQVKSKPPVKRPARRGKRGI